MESEGGSETEVVMDEKKVRELGEDIPTTTKQERQVTHGQSQSLLFQKLPPELRALIWRECVGSYDIFIGVRKDERYVRHFKLREGKGFMAPDSNEEEQYLANQVHDFMPLLRSCRRIYTEAISLVYSSNTFLLSHPRSLLSFSATTLTNRFTSISSLCIHYSPGLQHGLSFGPTSHDLLLWRRASHLLSSMKGLKHLTIVLSDRSLYGNPGLWDNLEELLGELKRVRQGNLRNFKLVLQQKDEVEGLEKRIEDAGGGGELPFKLLYGLEHVDNRLLWIL